MAATILPGVDFCFDAEHISTTLSEVVESYNSALDLIAAGKATTFAGTFGALAAADDLVARRTAGLALPALVASCPATRAASAAAKERLRGLYDAAYARPDLYSVLKAVEEAPPAPPQARLRTQMLAAFERHGTALPADARAQVAALDAEEARLQGEFEQRLNEDATTASISEEETAGLSAGLRAILAPDPSSEGRLLVDMKAPVRVPFMLQATSAEARKRVLIAAHNMAVDENEARLERLVCVRHERAILLGFPSHAHLRLAVSMAGSPAAAHGFLDNLAAKLAPRLADDLKALKALKDTDLSSKGQPLEDSLHAWDVDFYEERYKQQHYNVDQEALRRWFPLPHVRDAMFRAYEGMLGLKIQQVPDVPSRLQWHPSVELFAVTDAATGAGQGHFFLDLHSRPGKFSHQCVVALAPSLRPAHLAACAMLGNLPAPTASGPALLLPTEVETLFHEFGHVMHCLCTDVPHSRLAWTWPMMPWPGGVEQDFLEIPSVALEQFVFKAPVLRRLAASADAETLGDDVIHRLAATRHSCAGLKNRRIIAMMQYDLLIHAGPPPYAYGGRSDLSLRELWHVVMAEGGGYPLVPDTFRPASWYHMAIGYDAGYYSYLWADVLAADLLEAFPADDPLDPEAGRRFRTAILSRGGAEPGEAMVRDFLGRPPSDMAFLRQVGLAT